MVVIATKRTRQQSKHWSNTHGSPMLQAAAEEGWKGVESIERRFKNDERKSERRLEVRLFKPGDEVAGLAR